MHVKRISINKETWFQINGTDVFVDPATLVALANKGIEIIDDDCVRLELERMANLN